MNRAPHIRYFIALMVFSVLSVVLLPCEALCRLIGEADISYAKYDSSVNNTSYSGSSFAQRYSILYDTSGVLVGGRLGRYNVSLGYEWLAYDTTEKLGGSPKNGLSETRGHINYRGDLTLNPKELPFKLHIYSQDPSRSTFSGMGAESGGARTSGYAPVQSNIITNINNGIHTVSGATLVMGVKNGMTNGYNEVLRHFPMLMLDFKDQVDKDLSRDIRVDTRLSRLAFVSLNKKDNWFHYRYVTFSDKIDGTNNYVESQIQLGTVDHRLERRWIDFSNWLSVSADGQYTKRMKARSQENYDEINLNLFGIARRSSWELRAFNTLTRLNEMNSNTITYMTSMPLYANGTISPTAEWRATAKYNDNHTNTGEFFNTINGAYSVDAFRKSPFTVSHGLSVERVSLSSGTSALITGGSVTTASTPLFSRAVALKTAYNITNYRTEMNGSTNNSMVHKINADARYNWTNQLFLSVQETLHYSSGSSHALGSNVIGAEINTPLYDNPDSGSGASGGSSYASVTNLRVDWIASPRLRFGFSGSESVFSREDGDKGTTSRLAATVDYNASNLKISSNVNYAIGEDISSGSKVKGTLSSSNNINFSFSRNLDTKLVLTYMKEFGNGTNALVNMEQALNYRYRGAGNINNLFEINESFTSVMEVFGEEKMTRRNNTVLLGAKYFPMRQLMVAGGGRYFFSNNGGNSGINYYGSVSMSFRLLTASIDYTYGKSKTDDRIEKRLSASLKKRF